MGYSREPGRPSTGRLGEEYSRLGGAEGWPRPPWRVRLSLLDRLSRVRGDGTHGPARDYTVVELPDGEDGEGAVERQSWFIVSVARSIAFSSI